MSDCRLVRKPKAPIKIVGAGQSPPAPAFAATYADYNFTLGKGVNTPTAHLPPNGALMIDAAANSGRDVGYYVLFHW